MDVRDRLLAHALTYPEAWEDHPWEETVVKVRKRIFVFLGAPEGRIGCTVKVPGSGPFLLNEDFATPAGYGLGRSGWVSMSWDAGADDVPVDLLLELIDESYRTVAPKTLVAQLDG